MSSVSFLRYETDTLVQDNCNQLNSDVYKPSLMASINPSLKQSTTRTDSDDHIFVLLVKQASTKYSPLKQYLLCKEI